MHDSLTETSAERYAPVGPVLADCRYPVLEALARGDGALRNAGHAVVLVGAALPHPMEVDARFVRKVVVDGYGEGVACRGER